MESAIPLAQKNQHAADVVAVAGVSRVGDSQVLFAVFIEVARHQPGRSEAEPGETPDGLERAVSIPQ